MILLLIPCHLKLSETYQWSTNIFVKYLNTHTCIDWHTHTQV